MNNRIVEHPGKYLLGELDLRGWSQVEFAEIIGRSPQFVNRIVNGKTGISARTAQEFGAALGMSAQHWMNLNTAYMLRENKDE